MMGRKALYLEEMKQETQAAEILEMNYMERMTGQE